MNRKTFNKYLEVCIKLSKDFSYKHPSLMHAKNKLVNKMNNEILYQNFSFVEDKIKNAKSILDFGFGMGDKAIILREINKNAKIKALDTRIHNDIDDKVHKTKELQKELETFIKFVGFKKGIEYIYYLGKDIPFAENSFDLIFAYAVIEHIAPENRPHIVNELYRILKPNGYLLVTRLPRYYSIMEYLARKFNMEAHPWVLKKQEVYNLFQDKFSIEKIKMMDSTFCFPTKVTNLLYPLLIVIDNICTFSQINFWAHDYSLILRKKNK
jgi:ubiquinone/menaquinone biosynthesis C-methylase UbiE